MKSQWIAWGLLGLSATTVAHAQDAPRVRSLLPSNFTPGAPSALPTAPTDDMVRPAASTMPGPLSPDQIKPATLALPTDPIEPYLLTKDQGPFMVLGRTFRGPEAERFAVALAKELRTKYNLPAYILRTKDFPNKGNIRNVPPTANPFVKRSELAEPEHVRSHDEAAVLIGNCKTLDESEALWKEVKKLKPQCLEEIPSIFGWRKGLSTATRTTNPFVPAQYIYPGRGKRDHLLTTMNSGPRSIVHCPGRYTLQVAVYSGRETFVTENKPASLFSNDLLKKSPLMTAAEDAERVAEVIAKDPAVLATGYQPYVFHDRSSSKVLIGSFNDPNDPAAANLREVLLRRAVPIANQGKGAMIAPATQLTDLEDPNRPIKLLRRPSDVTTHEPAFTIVLGTRNPKKGRELAELIAPPWEPNPRLSRLTIRTLSELDSTLDVVEDADTFAGNARKKASETAIALNQWVLADDSGLTVDALDGAPGVYSARYAGTHGDDEANNRKVLAALADVPDERRGAAFVCALALADPSGAIRLETRGACRGRIIRERAGRPGSAMTRCSSSLNTTRRSVNSRRS